MSGSKRDIIGVIERASIYWEGHAKELANDAIREIERLRESLDSQAVCTETYRQEIERLREALAEAMRVRHYCDMEGDADVGPGPLPSRDRPYEFDDYLVRWATILGRRVYSRWPDPTPEEAGDE